MREAIRQALINGVPEVEGRIFEPHTASADTQKPYLIVRELSESDNTEWAGFRCRVEVWPYCERTSYIDVDTLAKKINNVLDKQLLGSDDSDAITCIADGMSTDTVDEEWDALTRCVNFYVLALQPATIQGPIINDPWITALVDWSKTILNGIADGYYGGILPTGYKRPSVLWRLSNISMEECGMLGFDVIKQITCHIFGRNAVEEINIAAKLAEEIQTAIKIPLDISKRYYMLVRELEVRAYSDASRQGQLEITLSRKVKRPQNELPLMQEATFKGKIGGKINV